MIKNNFLIEELIGEKGNAYSSSRHLLHNIKMREKIDFEVGDGEKGGMIIFSTNVNAIPQSQNSIINWVKQKVKTINNRLSATKKIDAISQKHNLVGWSVGKGLSGRYTAKNGVPFEENSLSVEIIGVGKDELVDIATELCKEFDQESVLVKDYINNKIYFVDSLKEEMSDYIKSIVD